MAAARRDTANGATRDTTRALEIARELKDYLIGSDFDSTTIDEMIQILDPSQPMPGKPAKRKRPITTAEEIVDEIVELNRVSASKTSGLLFQLKPLLARQDARTGRLEPELRKGYRPKKRAKKRAKVTR